MRNFFYSSALCCIVLIAMAFISYDSIDQNKQPNFPLTGFVPDEKTAISISEILLFRLYGKEILSQKPFKAHLIEDSTIWVVEGTLEAGFKGGVVKMLIQKRDCKVISLSHGK
jgi:hypothetical protein